MPAPVLNPPQRLAQKRTLALERLQRVRAGEKAGRRSCLQIAEEPLHAPLLPRELAIAFAQQRDPPRPRQLP